MAIPVSRAEFAKDLQERAKTLALMPAESRVCPTCLAIYRDAEGLTGNQRLCWCDYESDWGDR